MHCHIYSLGILGAAAIRCEHEASRGGAAWSHPRPEVIRSSVSDAVLSNVSGSVAELCQCTPRDGHRAAAVHEAEDGPVISDHERARAILGWIARLEEGADVGLRRDEHAHRSDVRGKSANARQHQESGPRGERIPRERVRAREGDGNHTVGSMVLTASAAAAARQHTKGRHRDHGCCERRRGVRAKESSQRHAVCVGARLIAPAGFDRAGRARASCIDGLGAVGVLGVLRGAGTDRARVRVVNSVTIADGSTRMASLRSARDSGKGCTEVEGGHMPAIARRIECIASLLELKLEDHHREQKNTCDEETQAAKSSAPVETGELFRTCAKTARRRLQARCATMVRNG